MEEVRERLPFCLDFVAVNCCIYMYLFASPESVVLKETVMLTQKTRHSMIVNWRVSSATTWRRFVYRSRPFEAKAAPSRRTPRRSAIGNNLTVARHEAYKQRGKRGELRRLAATQNNQLNSSGA